jgi:hypothetical protein
MHELGVVHRSLTRPPRADVEALAPFGVSTLHDTMGRTGLMRPYIRPVYPGARLCGTAVTVLLQPADNWMLHVAVEQLRPGDVVVAACTTEWKLPWRTYDLPVCPGSGSERSAWAAMCMPPACDTSTRACSRL